MKKLEKYWILILFLICLIFSLALGNILEDSEETYGHIIISVGLLFLFIAFLFLDRTKKLKKEYAKYFIFSILLFVYIGYIFNTNCGTRQHDTRSLNWEYGGHLGYIEYLLEYKTLPNFNPTLKWCFTNPPLFYILSAIFVKFQNIVGRYDYQAIENLQFLTVFFTMVFNIYLYKILELLEAKKSKEYISLFVGLSPAIVFLSGSLNNDILSIALETIAIFYSIKWYKETKLVDLIKIAFSISFALMTKINTAILAFPIAILFLMKIFKEKDNFKKYLLYYVIFAIIALPIGLWFPIRNLVKYNIPITYVQEVVEKEENDGYIGYKSMFERLFKFDEEHIKTLNIKFEKGKSDYNIFLTTLKSFIVDEHIDYSGKIMIAISLYIMIIIVLGSLALFIYSCLKNSLNNLNIFMYTLLFFETLFYIKFCFEYPYAFTMNFRYIVPIIIALVSSIVQIMNQNQKIEKISQNAIIIYSIFSIILFINI